MWIERQLSKILAMTAKERPVVLVTGARQTGKTSLCEHAFVDRPLVSLDLPRLAEEAEEAGEQFLQNHPPPLIIDEVQYAPTLLRYVKNLVDKRRDESGLFIITGSQQFNLMQGVTESLAGRVSILQLHTLSLKELEVCSGKKAEGPQLLEWILTGGYPEVHARDLDVERFYADYVATYLERDVRQALKVKNLRDFNRFMRLLAVKTGQLLSLSSLASDVGTSPNTIKSWLSVLEASQIIRFLEPYHRNLGKRVVKTQKIYFLDTGLACFLSGIHSVEVLKSGPMLGAMFETLVFGQMVRWAANRGKTLEIYFYRDHLGAEVDFVIPQGEKLKLYECKWSETPSFTKGFHVVRDFVGAKNVLNTTVINPIRGHRKTKDGLTIEDCVDLTSLAE